MTLQFYKYQGTGNDFVLIDNRTSEFPKNDAKRIETLCDRKFGIGADGLIAIEDDDVSDFRMVYFNADGNEGSLCGNGGRCAVAFANFLGIIGNKTTFRSVKGTHDATIDSGEVSLHMPDVPEIRAKKEYLFLDTGSPHHVQLVNGLKDFKVFQEGKKLRYGLYGATGSNINFVEPMADATFSVRTYERGVENETLSCGTGVTAVALAMHNTGRTSANSVDIETPGGKLRVTFRHTEEGYKEIYLTGPATQVFKGEIKC